MLPSRLDATAQRSLVTAAARKTTRSMVWPAGKVFAVATTSTAAATATKAMYVAAAGDGQSDDEAERDSDSAVHQLVETHVPSLSLVTCTSVVMRQAPSSPLLGSAARDRERHEQCHQRELGIQTLCLLYTS